MNYYNYLNFSDVERLIDKNSKRIREEQEEKIKKLKDKLSKKIKLKNYIIKNSDIDILDKIIRTCLVDRNLSGVSKTKLNETVEYKRKDKYIEFNVNNKLIKLSI